MNQSPVPLVQRKLKAAPSHRCTRPDRTTSANRNLTPSLRRKLKAAPSRGCARRKGQTIPPSRTEDVRADEIDPLAGEPDGEFSGKELAALHAQYLRQRSRLLRRTAIAAVLVLILAVWFALRPSAPTHADFSETAADEAMSAEN